tara:strand:+ start:804 stop:1364 length:561 start_codon:yes stop_codon:yes gene_type:complete
MSGKHPNSDHPESEDELESLLKRLQPTPLEVDQVASLQRDCLRATGPDALALRHGPTHMQWKRVIPLIAISCLLIGVFGFYQFGGHSPSSTQPENLATVPQAVPQPVTPVEGYAQNSVEARLVPVSSQGFVVKTSSGGVIQTEDGPREKMTVKYEDAYHWRDPETGTNVRFFSPRNEQFTVPLQTD